MNIKHYIATAFLSLSIAAHAQQTPAGPQKESVLIMTLPLILVTERSLKIALLDLRMENLHWWQMQPLQELILHPMIK